MLYLLSRHATQIISKVSILVITCTQAGRRRPDASHKLPCLTSDVDAWQILKNNNAIMVNGRKLRKSFSCRTSTNFLNLKRLRAMLNLTNLFLALSKYRSIIYYLAGCKLNSVGNYFEVLCFC